MPEDKEDWRDMTIEEVFKKLWRWIRDELYNWGWIE